MYDFKHQIHKRPYFNSYKTFTVSSSQTNIYQQIKNTLFVVFIILAIAVSSIFLLDKYQTYKNDNKSSNIKVEYSKTKSKPLIKSEEQSQLTLKTAITQSIVKNLQAQKGLEPINDDELKTIISNIIQKIETAPQEMKYRKTAGEYHVL